MSFIVTEHADMMEALQDPEVQELAKRVMGVVQGRTFHQAMSAVYNVMLALKKERHELSGDMTVDGLPLTERIARVREFTG